MTTSVMARLNRIAQIVREKKAVPIGELCLQMNMAPSTMYQYARIMRNVFLDIKLENGIFQVTWNEMVEQLSAQTRLRQ